MYLKTYRFNELEDTDRSWTVRQFDIDKINLFVGINSSGKTRIINTIDVLAKVLSGRMGLSFEGASWSAVFEHGRHTYELEVAVTQKKVEKETLIVDGKILISRGANGRGSVWFEGLKRAVEVSAKSDDLLLANRQDELQHPYLEPLISWADRVRLYPFSSDLGRRHLWFYRAISNGAEIASENVPMAVSDPNNVVEQYVKGFELFGDEFDRLILRDFGKIGYKCSAINADLFEGIEELEKTGRAPIQLTVQEKGLKTVTRQLDMSTGMFRALAIIIHLNFLLLCKSKTTILLDDIGEGLDYERAAALVKLLINRCERNGIQVIMTSNDRFVMNAVDLRYWHLIWRNKSDVTVQDRKNSAKEFEDFSYLGLSNFDFFKSQVGH